MLNILVYSTSIVFYTGLKTITSSEKDYQIAGWARNGTELSGKYKKISPQMILVDYNELNSGILNSCQEYKQNKKCIMLILGKTNDLKNSFKGIDGNISVNGSAMELIESIRYFVKLLKSEIALKMEEDIPLTRREIEILRLIFKGETTSDISQELIISDHTTKKHISNIFRKLHVKNRLQAVAKILVLEGGAELAHY